MANDVQPATQKRNEIAVIRTDLEKMGGQFQAALPAHIPVERFCRVVMTAIQNNGDLVKCNRATLFNACVRAAQDGLLPDGREGAIVPYGSDAQWMPMVQGIRKKARNSGEIIDWDAHCVYSGDFFDIELGDRPSIVHKPAKSDRGVVIGAYSIAHLKDGGMSREWMPVDEIEAIRKKFSKAKKGPWHDHETYPEMCRKTVVRRHAKSLPTSSDLDDLIRRDDVLYDTQAEVRDRRPTFVGALDRLAGDDKPEAGDDKPQTEDVKQNQQNDKQGSGPSEGASRGRMHAARRPHAECRAVE